MKKQGEIEADFEVDKLTNSIENTITGEVFDTEIARLCSKDIRQIKKKDWVFEWDKHDHIFMSLIESAKFNMTA